MKTLLASALLLTATIPLSAALPGAEPLANLILSQFDTNSDALVDLGEWNEGITDSFSRLDANGDGFIQPDEVDGVGTEIAKETGDSAGLIIVALIKQVLLSLDANGDKLVSKEEFTKLSDSMFARLDGDKNTTLSAVELAELPTKLISR